ncbi:MAG: pectate lyase [Paludibacteraceae bacterium]|nr:pectate lyase [Paludibacteraceae bacterium]
MRKLVLLLAIVLAFISCKSKESEPTTPTQQEQALAFPGAEGGGKYATGGRGGTVYVVTSLEDDGQKAGTLRYALLRNEVRTIIFKVSGRIDLKSELRITRGNLSILGQSAPGDGICISGYPVIVNANNVVIRFLRFRMGDEKKVEGDALTVINSQNVIIDHCSFSWSTDECVSCYGNENFTLQYCFITESLKNSVHGKGSHGYAGIWGGTNASFHHNLIAHHDSRNPRFDHDYVDDTHRGPVDFVNNVVYNWGGNSAYGGESVDAQRTINFVANYYKPGPATNSKVKSRLVNPWTSCSNCTSVKAGTVLPPLIYLADNYMYGSAEVTADNWKGSTETSQSVSKERFTMSYDVTTQKAEQAFETVLNVAGCSLVRDENDKTIVSDVRNGSYTHKGSNGSKNGLIDTQSDAGGWPDYKTYNEITDADRDGMDDEWETAHGLNTSSGLDAYQFTNSPLYTNLEVYLNSLVEHLWK